MISGHATISTAMAAVKFGAFDFIEKPLSLDLLLMTIPEPSIVRVSNQGSMHREREAQRRSLLVTWLF